MLWTKIASALEGLNELKQVEDKSLSLRIPATDTVVDKIYLKLLFHLTIAF